MENKKKICQSCGMPLDNPEDFGTEKDGSLSQEYCHFCYKDGEFTNPAITMHGMKSNMRMQMGKQKIPAGIIEKTLKGLSYLKRWNTNYTW